MNRQQAMRDIAKTHALLRPDDEVVYGDAGYTDKEASYIEWRKSAVRNKKEVVDNTPALINCINDAGTEVVLDIERRVTNAGNRIRF